MEGKKAKIGDKQAAGWAAGANKNRWIDDADDDDDGGGNTGEVLSVC